MKSYRNHKQLNDTYSISLKAEITSPSLSTKVNSTKKKCIFTIYSSSNLKLNKGKNKQKKD